MHSKLKHALVAAIAVSALGLAGPAAATELRNGVDVSLAGSQGEEQFFTIEVPDGAASLGVQLRSGTGDVDLYVRRAGRPSPLLYDCRSADPESEELCSIANPRPGTWHILALGFTAFSGVTLEAYYVFDLRNGRPFGPFDAFTGETHFFNLELPPGARDLELSLSGGTGDANLSYFQHLGNGIGLPVDCGVEGTNDETCRIDGEILFGSFSIGVRAVRTFSGVSLTAAYEDPNRCSPAANRLCLLDDRFAVEVEWTNFENQDGEGRVVALGSSASDDSGLLYFFEPDNWEMLVKMVDACSSPFNSFWLFASATTTVEYTLRVADTETGAVRTWFNPLGNQAPAITDTQAFLTCP